MKNLKNMIIEICKDQEKTDIADIIDELYDEEVIDFWTRSYYTDSGYSHTSIEKEDIECNLVLDDYFDLQSTIYQTPTDQEIEYVITIIHEIQQDLSPIDKKELTNKLDDLFFDWFKTSHKGYTKNQIAMYVEKDDVDDFINWAKDIIMTKRGLERKQC